MQHRPDEVPGGTEEGHWVIRGGHPVRASEPPAPFPASTVGPAATVGDLVGQPQDAVPPPRAQRGGTFDAVEEALDYNNPFGQEVERVWFDGKIVYATELGELEVDPASVKVAQEYQVVYGVELDEAGRLVREPDRVPGQYNIYDSVPGMDQYSPLWQFNYVVVPSDYEPNTLRSEQDCLSSGYPVIKSNVIEN